MMKPLIVIPARGGSKGIPHKNIKPLNGKPLIHYTIDVAREIVPDNDICVSTDDLGIVKVVEDYGLKVPFIRPDELASDAAGTYEVLIHAICYYETLGRQYDSVILLQNTSPFRTAEHVKGAISLYRPEIDMVVSVNEIASNPYYNCFELGEDGFLKKTLDCSMITRRQDAPKTYEYNGAIYIFNLQRLKEVHYGKFTRCIMYEMDRLHSVDLDTMIDWNFAEFIIKEGLLW